MKIEDKHVVKMDDESDIDQFAAVFYITEDNLKDILTVFEAAMKTPKLGFHPRLAHLKQLHSQFKNAFR